MYCDWLMCFASVFMQTISFTCKLTVHSKWISTFFSPLLSHSCVNVCAPGMTSKRRDSYVQASNYYSSKAVTLQRTSFRQFVQMQENWTKCSRRAAGTIIAFLINIEGEFWSEKLLKSENLRKPEEGSWDYSCKLFEEFAAATMNFCMFVFQKHSFNHILLAWVSAKSEFHTRVHKYLKKMNGRFIAVYSCKKIPCANLIRQFTQCHETNLPNHKEPKH